MNELLSRRAFVGRAGAAGLALSGIPAAVAGCSSSPGSRSITVVTNAELYTLDPRRPRASAFAHDQDGVIVAVGTTAEVLAKAGDHAKLIDARGNTVLPGFQDTHVHVPEAGINEGLCFLPPGLSLRKYGELAADCAAEDPDAAWVRAAGASLFGLRNRDELPIDVLDRAIPDRPALILDDLGHAVWTNSRGLEAAGIGPDDPDPQGGIFHRDPATGRLTGLLLENAQQMVRNAAALDDDSSYRGLRVALKELARNGITTVSDAGGFWGQNHPAAWRRALDEGTLTVRGINALYVYPNLDIDEQLAELEDRFSDDPDSLLRFNTAKIYIDGILDLGTAAMIEPYDVPVDPKFPSGFFYFAPDELRRYVSELHRIGFRGHFHVIGDAAARTALDAIENIDAEPAEIAARRHRTTHNYLIDPDDVERFTELGVTADFQVGADSIDSGYHEFLADYIGDRAFDLIPVRRLLDAGAAVSLSSDWDADPLSPFGIIQHAVTRESNAVPDVETAIGLVTIDAAHALGHDATTGSIEVGKYADYVVIDQNLLKVDLDDIGRTTVLLTVLAGAETYRSKEFNP